MRTFILPMSLALVAACSSRQPPTGEVAPVVAQVADAQPVATPEADVASAPAEADVASAPAEADVASAPTEADVASAPAEADATASPESDTVAAPEPEAAPAVPVPEPADKLDAASLARLTEAAATIAVEMEGAAEAVDTEQLAEEIDALNTILGKYPSEPRARGLRGLATVLMYDASSTAYLMGETTDEPDARHLNENAFAPPVFCNGPRDAFAAASADLEGGVATGDVDAPRLAIARAVSLHCLGDTATATRLALAEMKRKPRHHVASLLTRLGHVGLFTLGEYVVPTGLPAASEDGSRVAIFGLCASPRGAAGSSPCLSLQIRDMAGALVAEHVLAEDMEDPSEILASSPGRIAKALKALEGHKWQTLEALLPLTDNTGELPRTAAFVRGQGGALLQLSQWSLTVDLGKGVWRTTLPQSARIPPGGPMRDDEGKRCELIVGVNEAHVDLPRRILLLQVFFYPMNDLCRMAVTTWVPLVLPGPDGGEGWKTARAGAAPPWFAELAEMVPEPNADSAMPASERGRTQRFVALWGAHFPAHAAVGKATRVLKADDKARSKAE